MTGTNSLSVCVNGSFTDLFGANPYYIGVAGGNIGLNGTESLVAIPAASAYTASHLGGRVKTNTYALGNSAVTNFRVAGANGNQQVVWTGAGSNVWVSDSTHSDAITAAQLYDAALVAPSGSFSIQYGISQVQLNASTPHIGQAANPPNSGSAYGYYLTYQGAFTNLNNAVEAVAKFPIKAAGTLSSLALNISTGTGTGTAQSRVNGANGNQSLSFSATGVAQDATHSDAVTAGQTADINSALTGSLNIQWSFMSFAGTTSAHDLGTTNNTSNNGYSGVSGAQYVAFGGNGGTVQTTAANAYQTVPYGLTASGLRINIGTNSANSGTLQSYIAGSAGNQSVTIASSATGLLSDATHTDVMTAGQTLAGYLNLASANTFYYPVIAITVNDSSYVGASPPVVPVDLAVPRQSYRLWGFEGHDLLVQNVPLRTPPFIINEMPRPIPPPRLDFLHQAIPPFTILPVFDIGAGSAEGSSNVVGYGSWSNSLALDYDTAWSIMIYGPIIEGCVYDPQTRFLKVIFTNTLGQYIVVPNQPYTVTNQIIQSADPEALVLGILSH